MVKPERCPCRIQVRMLISPDVYFGKRGVMKC